MNRGMPNTTRHHGAERTILFPFDPSSLLATLAEAWTAGQRRPDGLSWRERRTLRTIEQRPVIGADAPDPAGHPRRDEGVAAATVRKSTS